MKNALCTLCIGEEAKIIAQYSHPVFQQYADKINADFIILKTPKINYNKCSPLINLRFEKYQIYDLLEEYSRILYLDTDILITPYATNIFKVVDPRYVGCVFEDFGMEQLDRHRRIQDCQRKLGDISWNTGYFNSGVLVLSQQHRDAFHFIFTYGTADCEFEQTNINWYFRKAGYLIQDLDYQWNYMGIMWIYYGTDPRKAYFLHYAGQGIYPEKSRIQQIYDDFIFFYKK